MKRLTALILSCLLLCSCSLLPKELTGDTEQTSATEPVVTENPIEKREPDSELVATAYLSGDSSNLNTKEKELLAIAAEAVGKIIDDSMTDAQKCVAIHDYIVTNGTYDTGALGVIYDPKEYSHIAYGFLTEGEGICSGYADTFKLFADMTGIENILVKGNALTEDQEHQWNLVCLDGEWYHMDCTWDDFVPDEKDRPAFHMYTLETDDVMELESHFWDRENYPVADGTRYNYYKNNGKWFEDNYYINDYVSAMKDAGLSQIEVAYPTDIVGLYVPKLSYYAYPMGDYTISIFLVK